MKLDNVECIAIEKVKVYVSGGPWDKQSLRDSLNCN